LKVLDLFMGEMSLKNKKIKTKGKEVAYYGKNKKGK
jgi:hypothetical protein